MNTEKLKERLLLLLRAAGVFRLTRLLMRRRLLILAYHGVSLFDEAGFNPNLFITPDTLQQRLRYLKQQGYTVMPLSAALEALDRQQLPANTVVITFDDGWYSTGAKAAPLLAELSMPFTLYVTSYYVEKNQPVLNVVMRYIFYKSSLEQVDLSQLQLKQQPQWVPFTSKAEREILYDQVFAYFTSLPGLSERLDYVRLLAQSLRVDIEHHLQQRCFNLLTSSELTKLAEQGVDLQLHTHRHRMEFSSAESFLQDIADNRASLTRICAGDFQHFCYPSGQHTPQAAMLLRQAGIQSATTCAPGFVTKHTDRYFLPRFLDGENISQLLFEAEVTGVLECLRLIKRRTLRLVRR